MIGLFSKPQEKKVQRASKVKENQIGGEIQRKEEQNKHRLQIMQKIKIMYLLILKVKRKSL